jgi:predicted RNA-binding Zn-ribbon protein involved in translation (DUF1610 family)
MTRKHICPACGEKEGVPIMYGYPSHTAIEASERGEVALGGCCIGDNDPERRCLKCEHEWRIEPRKYVCPTCGEKAGIGLRDGFPSGGGLDALETITDRFGMGFRPQREADRLCLKCGKEWETNRRITSPFAMPKE